MAIAFRQPVTVCPSQSAALVTCSNSSRLRRIEKTAWGFLTPHILMTGPQSSPNSFTCKLPSLHPYTDSGADGPHAYAGSRDGGHHPPLKTAHKLVSRPLNGLLGGDELPVLL